MEKIMKVVAKYFGTALLWAFWLLGDLVRIVLTEIVQGVGTALGAIAPYLAGVGVLWYLDRYQPESFSQILTFVIIALVFWILVRSFRRKKRRK